MAQTEKLYGCAKCGKACALDVGITAREVVYVRGNQCKMGFNYAVSRARDAGLAVSVARDANQGR